MALQNGQASLICAAASREHLVVTVTIASVEVMQPYAADLVSRL